MTSEVKFKIGDNVNTVNNPLSVYKILGIYKDMAWLNSPEGCLPVYGLESLRAIPKPFAEVVQDGDFIYLKVAGTLVVGNWNQKPKGTYNYTRPELEALAEIINAAHSEGIK